MGSTVFPRSTQDVEIKGPISSKIPPSGSSGDMDPHRETDDLGRKWSFGGHLNTLFLEILGFSPTWFNTNSALVVPECAVIHEPLGHHGSTYGYRVLWALKSHPKGHGERDAASIKARALYSFLEYYRVSFILWSS